MVSVRTLKISHLEKSDLHENDLMLSRIHTASTNKMVEILAESKRIKGSLILNQELVKKIKESFSFSKHRSSNRLNNNR